MFDSFAIGLAGLVCLLLLIAVRVPVGYTMIIVGIAGISLLNGPAIILNQLKDLAYAQFSNYDLSVLPMFILMGALASRCGLSSDLFRGANAWLGRFRGGVAMAAIAALWVMIAVLGFSRYLCARVVWRNDVATTLATIESIWQELGGVASRLTSDNPKCFALTACRYEPVLNPAFERFATHYGFIIECLPPRDPQKKGKIERMVPYVRRLYEAHGEFISLDESQQYLNHKLAIANQRRHGTTQRQPIDDLAVERTHLRALPTLAYEIEESSTSTVRQDGHVRFANRYYSLDERFIGEDVLILGSSTQLAVYHAGQLIETHQRLTDPYQIKQTKPQHLKPWERSLSEDSIYRQNARKLGPFVEQMIVNVLRQGQGFIDTRKVWGILCLDKEYAPEAINAACKRALELKTHGYRAVRRFLKHAPKAKHRLAANPRSARSYDNESTVASEPGVVQYKYTRDLSVYSQQIAIFPTHTHTPENDA